MTEQTFGIRLNSKQDLVGHVVFNSIGGFTAEIVDVFWADKENLILACEFLNGEDKGCWFEIKKTEHWVISSMGNTTVRAALILAEALHKYDLLQYKDSYLLDKCGLILEVELLTLNDGVMFAQLVKVPYLWGVKSVEDGGSTIYFNDTTVYPSEINHRFEIPASDLSKACGIANKSYVRAMTFPLHIPQSEP